MDHSTSNTPPTTYRRVTLSNITVHLVSDGALFAPILGTTVATARQRKAVHPVSIQSTILATQTTSLHNLQPTPYPMTQTAMTVTT